MTLYTNFVGLLVMMPLLVTGCGKNAETPTSSPPASTTLEVPITLDVQSLHLWRGEKLFNSLAASKFAVLTPTSDGVLLAPIPESRTNTNGVSSGGKTAGVSIEILDDANFSAQTVSIIVTGKSQAPGAMLAVAYSTNDAGNSGWKHLSFSDVQSEQSFSYDVPAVNRGRGDYVSLLPLNGAVEVIGVKLVVEE